MDFFTFREAMKEANMTEVELLHMSNKGYLGEIHRRRTKLDDGECKQFNRVYTPDQVRALKLIRQYKDEGMKVVSACEKAWTIIKKEER